MNVFCTYFDHGFTVRALALAESLRRHMPDTVLWCLCFDGDAYDALTAGGDAAIRPIRLAEFLADDPALAATQKDRSRVEFYFTCTPSLPLYVLRHDPDATMVTYVDADLYVFADPQPLFDAMYDASISLIAHRFPPALADRVRNGIYNVGWLSFRRDADGLAALQWWRERCIEWCYDRHEDGKYADQKYLDDWPTRFNRVTVLAQGGANLAPWNLATHQLADAADGAVSVDGGPLYFYHFHGLKPLAGGWFDPHLRAYGVALTPTIRERIYAPYLAALVRHADRGPLRYRLRGNGWRLVVRRLLWYVNFVAGLMSGRFVRTSAGDH